MQLNFLLAILVLSISGNTAFSQSKKKQIEHLKFKLDSINQVLTSERNTNSIRDIELNKTIQKLEVKNSSIEQRLKQSESEINKKNEILKDENRKILNLTQEISSLQDSLNRTHSKNALQLIGDFELKLSDNEILQILESKNKEFKLKLIEGEKNIEIQGRQAFNLNGEKQCIVVLGIRGEDGSHGGMGTNALVNFTLKKNQWQIKSYEISSLNTQWGDYAELEGICSVGKENIAIVLSGYESGQGSAISERKIFLLYKEKFTEAHEGLNFENNSGEVGEFDPSYYNHEYEISFKDTGKDFFDLIETFKSRGKYVSEKIYHFNDQTMKYEN